MVVFKLLSKRWWWSSLLLSPNLSKYSSSDQSWLFKMKQEVFYVFCVWVCVCRCRLDCGVECLLWTLFVSSGKWIWVSDDTSPSLSLSVSRWIYPWSFFFLPSRLQGAVCVNSTFLLLFSLKSKTATCLHRLDGFRRSRWSPAWRLSSSPTASFSGWVCVLTCNMGDRQQAKGATMG